MQDQGNIAEQADEDKIVKGAKASAWPLMGALRLSETEVFPFRLSRSVLALAMPLYEVLKKE